MRKILLYYPDAPNEKLFSRDTRDNFNDPFIFLKNKLDLLGYELKTSANDSLEKYEWIIFMDSPFKKVSWKNKVRSMFFKKHIHRDLYAECLKKGLANKMAIFLWEGSSVNPCNYLRSLHNKFSIIFTWNDDLVDNKKFFKFYLPIPEKLGESKIIPFDKKKLVINVSANKYSSFEGELYSERRNVISFFEKTIPNNFDLYGRGWNTPKTLLQKTFPFTVKKFSSYKGLIKNKKDILPYYKFSLSYENLCGENGYVTEKIFDSMRLKTIPIYLGASNITKYVPSETFIDRRKYKSNTELLNFIEKFDEKKYNEYMNAISLFLKSDEFKLFLPENFSNTIIKTLNLKNNL